MIKRIHNQLISSDSDSDGSVSARRGKTNYLDKPIQLGPSDDEGSQGSGFSNNSSGYYEENLFNEIERILIEIINNHINTDKKKNEKDVQKFQNHVREGF
jgi:hypothetical protein